MKKHRNFLIFYSLWLGAIVLLLTVFDTPQDKNIGLSDQNSAVCTLTKSAIGCAEEIKSCDQLCCLSKPSKTTARLQ